MVLEKDDESIIDRKTDEKISWKLNWQGKMKEENRD